MPGASSRRRDPQRKQFRRDVSVVLWVFFILALVFVVPFAIVSLVSDDEKPPPVATPTETVSSCAGTPPPATLRDPGPFVAPGADDVDTSHVFVATIKTYCGNMLLKIDPKDAPEAARSFVFLARKRFYNGLTIDRIVAGSGLTAAAADPGYSVAASSAGRPAVNDVVMLTSGGRAASAFGVVAGTGAGVSGAKIGTVLPGDAQSLTVLRRLMAQPAPGGVPSPALHILHIEIEEFTRE